MSKLSTPFLKYLLFFILISACSRPAQTPESATEFMSQWKAFQETQAELNKPTIWDIGDTTITNEDRLDLFEPHIRNLQGGYVGVGSTQNLSLAAWARSEWIWLLDFTNIVVRTNRVNLAFLQEAETPEAFRRLWESRSEKEAFRILDRFYMNDSELANYKKAYKVSRPYQLKRFRTDDKIYRKRGIKLWLYDESSFNYIRNLAKQGRILAIAGDLRGDLTVLSIAKQAKKMGIVIRTVYFSNAEEYFSLDGQFRKNWLSIPFDEKSMVLRTLSVQKSKFPWAEDSDLSTDRGFHYAVQPALNFQKWLLDAPEGLKVTEILRKGVSAGQGVTICNGLYSSP